MASTAGFSADMHPVGTIGPNAVIRVIEALGALESPQAIDRIFASSRLDRYLARPPAAMIDEREVVRLHRALHRDLGDARARAVGWRAGELTADYLLRHRIPRAAQALLRLCPAPLASRLLARAIAANAWTFVGTGAFTARHGRPTVFTIRNCPIARGQHSAEPWCDFYAATFKRLYRRLVHPGARVVEAACQAQGAPACVFEITWRRKGACSGLGVPSASAQKWLPE